MSYLATLKRIRWARPILLAYVLAALHATHAGDRLIASGGTMEIEGSGGGGLTPWALITGLGTNREIGASSFCTRVSPQDFTLESCGIAAGFDDRLELSLDRQGFQTIASGSTLNQTVVGAKLRVVGDAIIDQDRWWPQVALGVQFKHNSDFDGMPKMMGAKHADGTDYYVAATKLWQAGPLGHSWVADLTLRETEANQMGLLGFGGDRGNYHLMAEGSLGVFLTDDWVLGGEYRQKPNNLSAVREQNSKDVFVTYFPVKYLSLTGAYSYLGSISNGPSQEGLYISLQLTW